MPEPLPVVAMGKHINILAYVHLKVKMVGHGTDHAALPFHGDRQFRELRIRPGVMPREAVFARAFEQRGGKVGCPKPKIVWLLGAKLRPGGEEGRTVAVNLPVRPRRIA